MKLGDSVQSNLNEKANEKIDLSELANTLKEEYHLMNDPNKNRSQDAENEWIQNKLEGRVKANAKAKENREEAKKLGPNSKYYPSFMRAKERAKERFQELKNDPERYKAYKERVLKSAKEYYKFDEKRDLLLKQMEGKGPEERERLSKLLELNDARKNKFKSVQEKFNVNRNNVRGSVYDAGAFESLIEKVTGNIANVKMGIKKKIKDDVAFQAKHGVLKPLLEAMDIAVKTDNKTALASAKKAFDKAANELAEKEPALIDYVNNAAKYYDFAKVLKVIHKQNWLSDKFSVADVGDHLKIAMSFCDEILKSHPVKLGLPNEATMIIMTNILNVLKGKFQ